MNAEELCRAYLEALERGDAAALAALFAPDGVVVSPLYGSQPAREFYAALLADTARSRTRLKRILTSPPPDAAIALHFDYFWTLADGTDVTFEVVDVFELNEAGDRIARMTIIYDTAPLRAAHEKVRAGN